MEKTEDKAFVISKKIIEYLTFSKYDTLVGEDGIEYLAGIKTDSSKNYFIFYDLVTGQEKFCKEFDLHTQAFYPVDVKNGIVAYLKKEKMN